MSDALYADTNLPELEACPVEDSLGQRIAFLAHQLDQNVRLHLDRRVAEFDLTGPQARLIRLLERPTPMNQVAGKLGCDPSNVTGIVDRLEARGFVERRVLPSDRRVKELLLTPAGERVQQCLMTVFDSVPGLADLSDRELQALHDLLESAVATPKPVPAL
jgi:DNA-binding MarR family transcriptional regulator